jgi:capsular exopolysaccharide synthesis family protein
VKRPKRTLFDSFNLDAPHVTEARRLLQTLARRERDEPNPPKVYMVTSASRGEGKSTICGLISMVAARIFRRKTLVIDADLRRPSLHALLGLNQRPGLAELMEGSASVEEATRSTLIGTLSAIPSGRPTKSVGDTYDDFSFRELLDQFRPQYDLIFIDCPPVVPVMEPLLIAEHVDALLLVAMAGATQVTMIRRMRQILAPLEPKIAGAILNNATDGLPYYYDYRYYGYESPKPKRVREIRTPAAKPPAADDAAARHVARERGGA